MVTETKKTPMANWRANLKEGDLIWVIHYNSSCMGIFKAFRPGSGAYYGCRLQYYNLPISGNDWYDLRLKEWEKGSGKPYINYINSGGEERVIPLDINMLTEHEKQYYKRLKRLVR